MLFGLANGVNAIPKALSAERATLTDQDGLSGYGFDFPTNGSGSPDSRAAAATTVKLLTFMSGQRTFASFFDSLPILGVDGSLAGVGTHNPARGKVFAKTGTSLDQSGIRAQVVAGYIDALQQAPGVCAICDRRRRDRRHLRCHRCDSGRRPDIDNHLSIELTPTCLFRDGKV